jgi:deoxyribodipyrimidine photolyase-related protein
VSDLVYLSGSQCLHPKWLGDHRRDTVLLVESDALCRRLPFHQQKLGLVLGAMRAYAKELENAGYRVIHEPLDADKTPAKAVADALEQTGAESLITFENEDRHLQRDIEATADELNRRCRVRPTPMFLTDTGDLDRYFADAGKPRMAGFYRNQRIARRLLLDDGCKPLGGKWSFDSDNRARLPKEQALPTVPNVRHSEATRACLEMVHREFADHPGDARDLWLPVDRAGARAWLERFLEERLLGFGTYEDALTTRSPVLFHSVLSPLLNIGLVTPEDVIHKALDAAEEFKVPLNDLEGFIRQIIGWREFIRGAYRRHRHTMRRRNVWGGERALTDRWLEGRTGLLPLDHAMANTRSYAWNHHIERLMVQANLMNLAEVHPDEVYRFFMANFLDAYDWVMVPNVFGMGLTSDGGIFTTKPYICGSNYIRKMSDYGNGDWAAVMDGLYWRFVARHRRVLATNPRLAMMVRALDRLDAKRAKKIFRLAEDFIEENTEARS